MDVLEVWLVLKAELFVDYALFLLFERQLMHYLFEHCLEFHLNLHFRHLSSRCLFSSEARISALSKRVASSSSESNENSDDLLDGGAM